MDLDDGMFSMADWRLDRTQRAENQRTQLVRRLLKGISRATRSAAALLCGRAAAGTNLRGDAADL